MVSDGKAFKRGVLVDWGNEGDLCYEYAYSEHESWHR